MSRQGKSIRLPPSGIYPRGRLRYEKLISLAQKAVSDDSGAIITYVGLVKSPGPGGRRVKELLIETYSEHSGKTLRNICREAKIKHKLSVARIYHFEGEFKVGEPLVIVIAAGRSRQNVFPAVKEMIHRYKTQPAIWKKEVYYDESSQWVR